MTKGYIKIVVVTGSMLLLYGCEKKSPNIVIPIHTHSAKHANSIITDCNYNFNEVVAGSHAPQSIIKQLELINVEYISLDGKKHKGQILTNKKMTETIRSMFDLMLQYKFPVAKVIPAVRYDNNDEKSMEDNNTYSFCYRNISYSKHSVGLAIDINPLFNPVRQKPGTKYRETKPTGAIYDINRPGTFSPSHPLIKAFLQLGLKWGHNFSNKYDDHHFEMKGNPVTNKNRTDRISELEIDSI